MISVLAVLVLENARGLLVITGGVVLYCGIAGFSVSAANIAAGVLLMAIGAYPYLHKRKP